MITAEEVQLARHLIETEVNGHAARRWLIQLLERVNAVSANPPPSPPTSPGPAWHDPRSIQGSVDRAPTNPNSFGKRVIYTRMKFGIGQLRLNRAAGLSQGHVSLIEAGSRKRLNNLTVDRLIKGFEKLGVAVTVRYLKTGLGPLPKPIDSLKSGKPRKEL